MTKDEIITKLCFLRDTCSEVKYNKSPEGKQVAPESWGSNDLMEALDEAMSAVAGTVQKRGGVMDGTMEIYQKDDGTWDIYDETYDITIHCESAEEQDQTIERLKRLRWIPVSERLPGNDDYVLVTCQTKKGVRSVVRAYWDGRRWTGSGSMSAVTAWKPLPEPYRGDVTE